MEAFMIYLGLPKGPPQTRRNPLRRRNGTNLVPSLNVAAKAFEIFEKTCGVSSPLPSCTKFRYFVWKERQENWKRGWVKGTRWRLFLDRQLHHTLPRVFHFTLDCLIALVCVCDFVFCFPFLTISFCF